MTGGRTGTSCAADRLVAHRGFPAAYPENSIAGVRAALEAGARYVEIDVQLSHDGVPVVVHDATLARVGRNPGDPNPDNRQDDVGALDWNALSTRTIGEPARFGDAFRDECVPSLAAMLALTDRYPDTTTFVELKSQSLERFGRAAVVESVLGEMRRTSHQTVAISFDVAALEMIRARADVPVGLGIKPWNAAARRDAERLAPAYLFVRADRIPAGDKPFWPGDWQWTVYLVDAPETARALFARGAALVETDRIGQMIPALTETAAGGKDPA